MSSVPEIKNKIAALRAEFRYTKNESTKLTILKKLDNLNKELVEAQRAEKKAKYNVQEQHQPKKDTNDINRGKVAEPGSNTSDNKQEEKKEDNKNQNNKKN